MSSLLNHFSRADGAAVSVNSISPHPSQPEQLVAGLGDGSLAVFDLRQTRGPVWAVTHHSFDGNLQSSPY